MCRKIIGNDVNFFVPGLAANDLFQKLHKLLTGMSGSRFANNFSALGIQGSVKR